MRYRIFLSSVVSWFMSKDAWLYIFYTAKIVIWR